MIAAGYPGTPSTEILETLAPMSGVYAEWCPNEKVAMDVAIGAAYAGVKSMAVMKHVGVNVAADALFYVAMTGVEGAMIIVVADDPGMHSSQGEQDTRHYAKFARVPCLEPSDSQEAKDMVADALALSERFDTPVFLRVTTRISHSHGLVELGPDRDPNLGHTRPDYRVDTTKYVMVPGNARRRHPVMEERTKQISQFADTLALNRVEMGDTSLGIVTSGVAYQYTKEVFPNASILRLGMTWPLPANLVADFGSKVDRLIVIEELDPVIEEEIKLMGIACEGKSIFPAVGELDTQVVRESAIAAGLLPESEATAPLALNLPELPPRPPLLCPGCPHRGVFSITRKLKLVVNGDIGCYTLGFLPPLGALHTCGCMGASIGQAHGVAKAQANQKNVAVIGDSTFFHTGMPALLNVAYNKSNTVTIILDNRTTAMTGHQQHPGTGQTLQMQPSHAVDLEALSRAMGIEDTYVIDPYDLDQVEETLKACVAKEGPAVVIAKRECVLLPEARARYLALRVDPDVCVGCGLCLRLGCPAMSRSDIKAQGRDRFTVQIDPLLCTGCELCAQVCPNDSITTRAQIEAELAESNQAR